MYGRMVYAMQISNLGLNWAWKRDRLGSPAKVIILTYLSPLVNHEKVYTAYSYPEKESESTYRVYKEPHEFRVSHVILESIFTIALTHAMTYKTVVKIHFVGKKP